MELLRHILGIQQPHKPESLAKVGQKRLGGKGSDKSKAEFPLIPGLPDDLALSCLARLPFVLRGKGKAVCRTWRDCFNSDELERIREKDQTQEHLLCTCLGNCRDALGCKSIVFRALDLKCGLSCRLPRLPTPWVEGDLTDFVGYKCVSAGSKLLILGGVCYSGLFGISKALAKEWSTAWRFNFATNTWQQLPRMEADCRQDPAVAVVGEQVVVVGTNAIGDEVHAQAIQSVRSSVEILDLRTSQWRSAAKLPEEPVGPIQCASIPVCGHHGRVLTLNGQHVYSYDIKTDSWRKLSRFHSPAPLAWITPSGSASMVDLNGRIYGVAKPVEERYTRPSSQAELLSYNPSTDKWGAVATLGLTVRKCWPESTRYLLAAYGKKLLILETWIDFQRVGTELGFVETFRACLHVFTPAVEVSKDSEAPQGSARRASTAGDMGFWDMAPGCQKVTTESPIRGIAVVAV